MDDFDRATDVELVDELERELARLELERSRATAKRDRIFSTTENGDDTGYGLIIALQNLKRVEQRIEQVTQLLSKERERSRQ